MKLPPDPLPLRRKLTSGPPSTISPVQPSPSIENKYQRFLPKQMVMGSPFYHSFEHSFKNSNNNNNNNGEASPHHFSHSNPPPSSSSLSNQLSSNSKNSIIHEEEDEDLEEEEEREKERETERDDDDNPTDTNNDIYEVSPRSIKFENLPLNIQLSDILSVISFGPIESCYYDLNSTQNSNTRSIIVTFIDYLIANQCFEYLNSQRDKLFNLENLKIVKVKSLKISNFLNFQINNNGATRVLFLSNLPINITDSIIINELNKFGLISSIQLNLEKNSIFVYFTSILNSIKCFNQLPLSNSILSNCNIFYSNDGDSLNKIHVSYSTGNDTATTTPSDHILPSTPIQSHNQLPTNLNNRTISLKNLTANTTIEDICNIIRGGNLENIKLFPDRRVAYLTFINHLDAANVIANLSREKIFINQRFIKVGWGKNNGDLDQIIKLEILENNATRNLYIGVNEDIANENDYDLINNEKIFKKIPTEAILRRDFSIFGEIEQINYFKNGACAFINFTNIKSCIQAVNDFGNEDHEFLDNLHSSFDNKYKDLLIFYGKDRCGNPPKKKKKKNKNKKKRQNIINNRLRNFHNDSDLYSDNESQFSYMLNNENNSIDTEIALKFESAFESIGISSPSAKKKVNRLTSNNNVNANDNTIISSSANNSAVADLNYGDDVQDGVEQDQDPDDDDDEVDIITDTITDTLSISVVSSNLDLPKLTKLSSSNSNNNINNNHKSHRSNNKFYNSRNSSNTSFHHYQNYNTNNNNNNYLNYNDQYADTQPTYILTSQPYYLTPQTPKNSKFLNYNQLRSSISSASSSKINNNNTTFSNDLIPVQIPINYYPPPNYYHTPTQPQFPVYHMYPPQSAPQSQPHHQYYKQRYSNNNKRKNYNNNQKKYYVDPASPTPDK